MSSQSTLKTSKSLEGVHGVQLVPHSPFELEQINPKGDFHGSRCENAAIGASQILTVQ